MSRPRSRWYPAVLAAVAVGLWLPRLTGPLDMRYDSGVYYILGTALAEGRGYRLLNEPGAIEAIQYPPLLPAIAALHQLALGTSDVTVVGEALRWTMMLMFVGLVLAVYALSRRIVPPGYAFLAALVTALNTQTVFMSDLFSAEIPYTLATVGFFVIALGGRERWRGPAAGVLAVASYALRAAGVALLAAWAADALLRREWGAALRRGALAAVAVGAWSVYTSGVKASADYAAPAYPYQRAHYQFYNVAYAENMGYVDPFRPELGRATRGDLARRAGTNIALMPRGLGEAVSIHHGWWVAEVRKINDFVPGLGLPEWLADVAVVGLSVPVVAGLVLLALRGHTLIVLYVAGSLVLMCVTPWPGQFTRYIMPLTPLLAIAFIYALRAAKQYGENRAGRWRLAGRALLAGAVGVVLVQETYTVIKLFTKHHQTAVYHDAAGRRHEQRLFFYFESWRGQQQGIDWLARHARPGELVSTSTPHWVYLRTGLPAVMPPYEADPREAQRLMDAVPVTWLIVDTLEFIDVGRRYTIPAVETHAAQWELAYRGEGGAPRIYRRQNVSASLGSK